MWKLATLIQSTIPTFTFKETQEGRFRDVNREQSETEYTGVAYTLH